MNKVLANWSQKFHETSDLFLMSLSCLSALFIQESTTLAQRSVRGVVIITAKTAKTVFRLNLLEVLLRCRDLMKIKMAYKDFCQFILLDA